MCGRRGVLPLLDRRPCGCRGLITLLDANLYPKVTPDNRRDGSKRGRGDRDRVWKQGQRNNSENDDSQEPADNGQKPAKESIALGHSGLSTLSGEKAPGLRGKLHGSQGKQPGEADDKNDQPQRSSVERPIGSQSESQDGTHD